MSKSYPGAYYVNTNTMNHIPGPRAVADYENIPLEEQYKIWNRPKDADNQKNLEEAGLQKIQRLFFTEQQQQQRQLPEQQQS